MTASHLEYIFKERLKEFMIYLYLLLKSIINVLDGKSKLNIMATFAVSQSI